MVNNFGVFHWIVIGGFIKLSVQTFQKLNVIYKRGNIVYQHLGCKSINLPLSYPFGSLATFTIKIKRKNQRNNISFFIVFLVEKNFFYNIMNNTKSTLMQIMKEKPIKVLSPQRAIVTSPLASRCHAPWEKKLSKFVPHVV